MPLEGRKKFAIATLVAAGAMAAISAWTHLDVQRLVERLSTTSATDDSAPALRLRAEDLDQRIELVSRLGLLALVLCAVAFLLWFYRAHENLRSVGLKHVEHTSGWAVGSFFVPVLGLFLPCQIMLEVWRGSAALAGDVPVDGWKRARASPVVLVWWLLFVGANVSAAVARFSETPPRGSASPFGPFEPAPTLEGLATAARWTTISDLVEIAAAAAAIYLVVRISSLQARTPDDAVVGVFD